MNLIDSMNRGRYALSAEESSCSGFIPKKRLDPIDLSEVGALSRVSQHIRDLIQSGTAAQEILVIFDVDGVLTNDSDPKKKADSEVFQIRSEVKKVLDDLLTFGVKIQASSAHASFSGTLSKLRSIGLSREFEIDDCREEKIRTGEVEIEGETLQYSHCGRVISVKGKSDRGYKRKAFAARLGLQSSEFSKVRRVAFVDDRADFIMQFKNDQVSALGDKIVDYFKMTPVQRGLPVLDRSHSIQFRDAILARFKEIHPPIEISPEFKDELEKNPEKILGLFPEQKLRLERFYLQEEQRQNRKTGEELKKLLKDSVQAKKAILELLGQSPLLFGRERELIEQLVLAFPGSSREFSGKNQEHRINFDDADGTINVLSSIEQVFRRSSADLKKIIIEDLQKKLSHSNIKVRDLALQLLKRYAGMPEPSVQERLQLMNPYSPAELQAWTFTDPKSYQKGEDFTFLIHGVFPDQYRPNDSTLGAFFPENVFKNPKAFIGRKRICTSLLTKQTNEKLEVVQTFAPTGVILKVPRENITYASHTNFASNGRYVSRRAELMEPKEVLKNTASDKYNEIIVEGTNRVTGTKSEIAGVFIKEGVKDDLAKEAIEFAKREGLPVITIPGGWKVPASIQSRLSPPARSP
ncbi:MAG: hypothetical protein ACO3A2_03470 [Bdellovibrionia bacterium]